MPNKRSEKNCPTRKKNNEKSKYKKQKFEKVKGGKKAYPKNTTPNHQYACYTKNKKKIWKIEVKKKGKKQNNEDNTFICLPWSKKDNKKEKENTRMTR